MIAPESPRVPGLGRRLVLAGLALFWERLWPALWPPLGVLGLFLALALLDLLPRLPGWLHLALLAAFAIAFVLGLARAVRRVSPPDRAEAKHRLEQNSGFAHRPLSSLEDELATPRGDPGSQALWRAHRRRLLAQIARLRVRPPRPGLPAADPLALRAIVVLLLFVAVSIGHGDWRERLASAVSPQLTSLAARMPASLDVWINPPAYTGLPPLFLVAAPPVETSWLPARSRDQTTPGRISSRGTSSECITTH